MWRTSKKARVTGTRRLGRLLLDDLEVAAHDDGVLLSFSLPKGAYATTVLREFMKNDGESGLADGEDTEGMEKGRRRIRHRFWCGSPA